MKSKSKKPSSKKPKAEKAESVVIPAMALQAALSLALCTEKAIGIGGKEGELLEITADGDLIIPYRPLPACSCKHCREKKMLLIEEEGEYSHLPPDVSRN